MSLVFATIDQNACAKASKFSAHQPKTGPVAESADVVVATAGSAVAAAAVVAINITSANNS